MAHESQRRTCLFHRVRLNRLEVLPYLPDTSFMTCAMTAKAREKSPNHFIDLERSEQIDTRDRDRKHAWLKPTGPL